MFWIPIKDKNNGSEPQEGECRRYPSPKGLKREADWWCGEGIIKGVDTFRGRNKA